MCSSLPDYFYSQLQEASIPVKPLPTTPDAIGAQSASEIDELAERCEGLEQRLVSLHDSYETLKRRELELKEWRCVLREAGGFFDRVCQAHMRPAFYPEMSTSERLLIFFPIKGARTFRRNPRLHR
jgi:hypothetical protein